MGSKPKKKPRSSRFNEKTQTIIQYSREVFIVANVNGFSNIAQAKRKTGMFLWTVILAFTFVGWLYQTSILLKLYYEYPTVVHIGVEKSEKMPFPAVTICNVNRIRRSVFCERFKDKCDGNKFVELSDKEIFNITMTFMKEGNKSILGHQLNDMLVKCDFTGIPELETEKCLEKFVPFYDPKMGNCFSMSSKGNSENKLYVTEPNLWQDMEEMTLVLNVETDEYLSTEADTPGIMVTLHEDMTFPNIFSDGIHAHPRQIYNMAVTKVTTSLLEKPYRSNCTNFDQLPFRKYGENNLTPRICTVQCVEYIQHIKCGHNYISDNVAIFHDTLSYNPDTVTKEDKECAERISNGPIYVNYCNSLCSVPCLDVSYSVSIDITPKKKKMTSESDLENYHSRSLNTGKIDTVSLHIHYKELEHRVFNHTPEFNTEELFSYIGGITGGWLGISLLDFCALMESILTVTIYAIVQCKPCKKRKRRKVFSKVKHRGPNDLIKIVPAYRKNYHFESPQPYYSNAYY